VGPSSLELATVGLRRGLESQPTQQHSAEDPLEVGVCTVPHDANAGSWEDLPVRELSKYLHAESSQPQPQAWRSGDPYHPAPVLMGGRRCPLRGWAGGKAKVHAGSGGEGEGRARSEGGLTDVADRHREKPLLVAEIRR
jgi:hypothetical protein